ncbi:MAG: TolC family outer membrane protein [Blastochloris viridis]|uniref:TolC family outer membrane protein n=1 Tax=Blastochloris viridis TaxID=1079 RepID=A0A6N4RE91_BLAVI|nr:MAG: TolC family outer membrane protein [Blastochloris viridis]
MTHAKIAIALTLAFAATTSLVNAASMQEAMATAIATHPEVLSAQKGQASIGHRIDMAKAGYKPKVDFAAGTGYEWSKNNSTRFRAARTPQSGKQGSRDLWRSESRITFSQMVFDGFQTKARVAQETNRFTSATFHVMDVQNQLALRAAEAYLGVLHAKELVALAEQNLATHKEYAGKISARVSGGRSSASDIRQVDGRAALAQANLEAAVGDLKAAEARYLEAVGEMPSNPVKAATPFNALPGNTKAAIDRAMSQSPVIASAMADIKAANAELAEAKSVFCPRVTLEGGISRNENLDGVEGPNNDMTAMVMVRQNLYNGGYDVAQRKERTEIVKQAQDRLEVERRQVEQAVIEAYSRVETAKNRLDPLTTHVEASMATRNAYAQQFDIGQRTLLDLLDSEVELFDAKAALIDGKYELDAAAYAVMAHMGDLAPATANTQVASK